MKKSEILEGVILLVSAVLLLPIWLAHSEHIELSPTLTRWLSFLQYPVIIVLGVIFVRRLRRIILAFRENKNRPGPF
jgi:hypothetical protein